MHQKRAVKRHCICIKKTLLHPGKRSGSCRARLSRRAPAQSRGASWQAAPLMCLSWSLFQLLLKGALPGPCLPARRGSGEQRQPPPQQRFLQPSSLLRGEPRVWGLTPATTSCSERVAMHERCFRTPPRVPVHLELKS